MSSSFSSTSSTSTRSEDIGVLYEDPEAGPSSPIDNPAGPSRRDSLSSLFNFSWERPGDNEGVDFHVDDSIVQRTRLEMSAQEPTLRIDREGLPLGRRGTPPYLPISDLAVAFNRDRIAQANWGNNDEWIMGVARNFRFESRSPSPPLSFTTSSDLSTATTLATSSNLSTATTLVNSTPMRPISPPVPTTEGRRRFQRIPVWEGDNDERVPLVPLIGSIEDLVQWPEYSPASSPPQSPVMGPLADPVNMHEWEEIRDWLELEPTTSPLGSPVWDPFSWLAPGPFAMDIGGPLTEAHLEEYLQAPISSPELAPAPWPMVSRARAPSPEPAPRASGPRSIPIVAEPKRSTGPIDQTLSPQLLSRHTVMYGRIMDRIR
ncbi:hypothetical protein LTR10_021163 [Elasticomyces elasticus]|nr:hypothetical protein LTR10_021163 [Elasticomyces elasticus]KAK5184069.1 hypothetical protein LTR44_003575 [Eurotiomycetes sp. CCFEE 6388]